MLRRKNLYIFVALFLFTVFLPSCKPAAKIEKKEAKITFTKENYAKLVANPNKFKGSRVNINGKIFMDPAESTRIVGKSAFQMWANPKASEWNTVVLYKGTAFKQDDYVNVIGTVTGQFEGENPFGGRVTAVTVVASQVKKIASQEVIAPTVHSVDVNQTKNQYGVVITIEKIEFAADETRVYTKVKNDSSSKVSFYDFNAKAIQGSTQFENTENYEADYPEVQSEILPGVESSGIVLFKPVDYNTKSCQIVLEARNENYDLDFKPYVFDVSW